MNNNDKTLEFYGINIGSKNKITIDRNDIQPVHTSMVILVVKY